MIRKKEKSKKISIEYHQNKGNISLIYPKIKLLYFYDKIGDIS